MSYFHKLPVIVQKALAAFLESAAGVAIVGLLPILSLIGQPSPDWSHVRVALIALAVASVTAGLRALRHVIGQSNGTGK